MQPVRTAFLYESKHRVNIMKRMANKGIHNQLGRKKGQVYLWEKLIKGEEVVVGTQNAKSLRCLFLTKGFDVFQKHHSSHLLKLPKLQANRFVKLKTNTNL